MKAGECRNRPDTKGQGEMKAYDLFRMKYGTALAQSQVINWIWYDTLTYTSTTTTLLTFFNAVRATQDLGNMELAGTLANPKAFLIRAIRVYFKTQPAIVTAVPSIANDVARLINNGFAQLTIGNKNYGTWPLVALPGGAGVYTEIAGAGAEATDEFLSYGASGPPDPRAVYALTQPLMIDPQINFQFTLNWAAAQTLTANTDIMVMLDGELMRPVQ